MSFILDALKKSESERQRQAGPALLEMRIVRPARRLPAWAIVVGTLLVVGVAVLAWLALRSAGTAGNAAAPLVAPVAAPAGAPANAGAGLIAAAGSSPVVSPQPDATLPVATAAPATTGVAESQSSAAAGDDNPADTEPAVAPQAGAARERAAAAGLRNYAELGGTLPELRLDLHVYAARPADRYAFINMHKVREGDITTEGAQVREITPEGVVLEFHGTEFLLGRQ